MSRPDPKPVAVVAPALIVTFNRNKKIVKEISEELGLIPKDDYYSALQTPARLFDQTPDGSGYYLITSSDIHHVFAAAVDENEHVRYGLQNKYYLHQSQLVKRLQEVATLGKFLAAHNKTAYNSYLLRTFRYLWLVTCPAFNIGHCKLIPQDQLIEENIKLDALEFEFAGKISDLQDAEVAGEHPSWGVQ